MSNTSQSALKRVLPRKDLAQGYNNSTNKPGRATSTVGRHADFTIEKFIDHDEKERLFRVRRFWYTEAIETWKDAE